MGKQLSLFASESLLKLPEGFEYYPEIISEQEEEDLIEFIENLDLHTFNFHGFEARRKVASFGFDYNFDKRDIKKGKPIPNEFKPLIKNVSKFLSIPYHDFEELLVTEYPAGSVINWHRDAPPFDIIVGLSLASNCTFRLRPYDKTIEVRGSGIKLNVERRSLYVIRGSAREEWEHSIAPVKEKRYSITLRTLRK